MTDAEAVVGLVGWFVVLTLAWTVGILGWLRWRRRHGDPTASAVDVLDSDLGGTLAFWTAIFWLAVVLSAVAELAA
jgi:hypothetical protein